MDELDNLLGDYNQQEAKLPLQKQFEIAKFNSQIDNATREQAIAIAKKAFSTMIIREQVTSDLVKKHWGLDALDQAA